LHGATCLEIVVRIFASNFSMAIARWRAAADAPPAGDKERDAHH
jgi:hypothetical protein